MNTHLTIVIGFVTAALIITAVIFYNAVITKKWRNQVPNEEECWKWGFIYYNPVDSRIFLPKRTGLGFTLNFAKPVSLLIILTIIMFIAFSIVLK